MIWQLVKRDPLWRNALIGMAVSAVVCPALPRKFIGMLAFLVGMYWLQSQPQRRATDFQAALPIRACDLFLARILSFFALVWLPVARGAALLLARRQPGGDGGAASVGGRRDCGFPNGCGRLDDDCVDPQLYDLAGAVCAASRSTAGLRRGLRGAVLEHLAPASAGV